MRINFPTLLYILLLPVFLFYAWLSLSLSPTFAYPNIEDDFINYYQAIVNGDSQAEQQYGQRIAPYLELPWTRRNNSLKQSLSLGIFSGNENIALTSAIVHFDYLLRSNKYTTQLSLIISSFLLPAYMMAGLLMISNFVLTRLYRFHSRPNRV